MMHLDAVALMCSRIALWRRFCEGKINSLADAKQKAAEGAAGKSDVELLGQKLKEDHEEYFERSGGARALETSWSELVAEYVGLEERFLISSVQKVKKKQEASLCLCAFFPYSFVSFPFRLLKWMKLILTAQRAKWSIMSSLFFRKAATEAYRRFPLTLCVRC